VKIKAFVILLSIFLGVSVVTAKEKEGKIVDINDPRIQGYMIDDNGCVIGLIHGNQDVDRQLYHNMKKMYYCGNLSGAYVKNTKAPIEKDIKMNK